jgi:hypothetical protein
LTLRLPRCPDHFYNEAVSESRHPVSTDDQDRYAAILAEIFTRAEGSFGYLKQDATVGTVEYVALQLRKMLELIVMGSLVTNRVAIEQVTVALDNKNVDEARKLARNANPSYWPQALHPPQPGVSLEARPVEGTLREEAWGRRWGMVSNLLHTRNPYQPLLDAQIAREHLESLLDEIMALLTNHIVRLVDRDFALIGQISTEGGHVTPIRRLEIDETPPGAPFA